VFALDLFGGESPIEAPAPTAVAVDLFTATAERIAFASGRPLSQERAELVAGVIDTDRIFTAYNRDGRAVRVTIPTEGD